MEILFMDLIYVHYIHITGESLPKDKIVGDAVYAGTININGYLEIKVTKASKDSTISKIVQLVSSAQKSKTQAEEFISTYNRKLNFLRSNGWNVNHSIVELTEDQKFRVDVIDMFQKINDLGFYIKYEWFYDLKYVDLIKLYVNMNKFIVSINNPIYSHIFNEKKRIIDMQYDSCELSRKLISMIIIENLNKLILTGTTKEDKITKVIWFLKVFITISYEAYRCLQFLRN